MKGFKLFLTSAKELKNIRCIIITGMLIAVSMVLEMNTILLPFAKINFAFIAIAVIGMLFGPTVGFLAGGVCDMVGYIAFPQGAFLPLYTAIACFQGLIYGYFLYYKRDNFSILLSRKANGKITDITLPLRVVLARLIDVVAINIILNTWANLHYKFISADSFSAAIIARVTKNVIELAIDLPLLIALLPAVLIAYRRVFKQTSATV